MRRRTSAGVTKRRLVNRACASRWFRISVRKEETVSGPSGKKTAINSSRSIGSSSSH
jgi:hypothetical protein